MTVQLRAHHLLCLLTYVGKGYTPAFTANYDVIAGRLSQGEAIVLVDGPDDICAALLGEKRPHCHEDSVGIRDRKALDDLETLLARPVRVGLVFEMDPPTLKQMRQAFAKGEVRQACSRCEWSTFCTAVAAGGFEQTRVQRH